MKTSIFKKLTQLISAILSIVFILTITVNYFLIESRFYSHIQDDLQKTTRNIAEHMEEHIGHTGEKFLYLVNNKEISSYYINQRQKLLKNLLDNYSDEFPLITIIDPKSKTKLFSSLSDNYKVIDDEITYLDKLKKKPNVVHISDVKYSEKLKKAVVVFSYLKKNYFDKEIAVIYSLFIIDDLFENTNKDYGFRLIDAQNTIVHSTIKAEINTQIIKIDNLPINTINEIRINEKENFYFIRDSKYAKIFMSIPKSILFDEILDYLSTTLFIYLFIIIFSFLIIFIYSKRITNPINHLLIQIEEYKNGNFKHKVQIDTNDEIALLADSFTQLGNRLNIKQKQLLDINQNLKEKIDLEVQEKLKATTLAMKAKDQFLASMSHEIRTPLNAILGFIQILKGNEIDTKKLRYLETIDQSSKSLLHIINDILDFNKIENQMLNMENIVFDPMFEFQNVKKLFDFKASSNRITLIKNFEKLPKKLMGDPSRIKQVLNNLISNAIKFTPQDKKIVISMSYKDGKLFVSVKDEGIGISQEYQKKIFIPFTQEDSSTSRKYGGTGLGLSISHKLISLMGGELKVKSSPKEGSDFYFSIPLKETNKKIDIEEKSYKNSFDAHILLAEDNPSNQLFMKILFKKLNLTFDIANDGIEAVEMYKTNKYDLVLMDENMPNMSGTNATIKILEYEKEHNLTAIPIIALTANALKGDKERFLSVGMKDYLSKPLKQIELTKVLSKYL